MAVHPEHQWSGSDIGPATLRILEWLADQGVNAMIRIDAERLPVNLPPWTFAASGGPLEQGLRADGRTAQECMTLAISRLREAGVRVPPSTWQAPGAFEDDELL